MPVVASAFAAEGPSLSFDDLVTIVVSIDPALGGVSDDAAETGIIVVGVSRTRIGYVLDDRSGKMHPTEWAEAAISAYNDWFADYITAEVNNGGNLVEANIRAVLRDNGLSEETIPYKPVRASRGKIARAEPISTLYARSRVFHVRQFPELESQMTSYEPGKPSPDRLDAMVWGLTAVMLGTGRTMRAVASGHRLPMAAHMQRWDR